jgi:PAS domain S-box-containing protein
MNGFLKDNKLFTTILENISSGVALIDETGKFVLYNQVFLKLFGLSEESTIKNINDQNWGEWLVFDEDMNLLDVDEHPVRKAAIYGTKVKNQLVAMQLPTGGDLKWMLISAEPILNNEGKLKSIICTYQDITERKIEVAAFRKNEQKLKYHIENSPLAVVEWDKEYDVIGWSKEAERMFGWKKEEVLGRKISSINMVYEEDLPILNNTMKRISGGKEKTVTATNRNYTKNRSVISCTWYNSVLVNEKGEMDSVLSLIDDITERRNNEEKLKESQENYKELIENARSAIIKADNNGYFTFFNDYAQKLFGYKEDEIIGKSALGTIIPLYDDKGAYMAPVWKKIFSNPDESEININENITKSGETLLIEWHNKTLYNKKGEKTGQISIGLNITERRNYERALEESKEKLEMAIGIGHLGLWEWNLKTDRILLDQNTAEILGIDNDIRELSYENFENLINEEDLQYFKNKLNLTFRQKNSIETVFRTKANNCSPKYISIRARSEKTELVSRITGVCFDMTGMIKETEQTIIKLNEELFRSNLDLQQFAYVASHDLQEPLRMVSSFTQLLQRRYQDKLDKDANEYIHYAVEGSNRMYELINGLLAYSRIQTRGKDFDNVNMNKVLENVKNNLSLLIEETGCKITYCRLPVIFADENQMIQLLQNLIENGIKFSRESPRINISYKKSEDFHVFSVKDQGIGVESIYSERIFKIFQRLHARQDYKGTGIGLAICKRIIERHKGKIWLNSQPGKGSTFYFSIPVDGSN